MQCTKLEQFEPLVLPCLPNKAAGGFVTSKLSTASARVCKWAGKGSAGDSSAARVRLSGKWTAVNAHLVASKLAC